MRVLIVTDGLLSLKETSVWSALRKQGDVHRRSAGPWLDVRLKVMTLERVLPIWAHRKTAAFRRAPYRDVVDTLLTPEINEGAPELTEVVLMTALAAEGVAFEATTYAELAADKRLRDRLLGDTDAVFASTTMLRGPPEIAAVGTLLKRPHNKVVAGGALTAVLHADWPGVPGIDLVAVGYGEWLVPALVAWLRTGELVPPPRGRVEDRGGTPILYSGQPEGKSLDDLPTPDWSLAEAYHGRRYELVHYESVRGCPYRCQFCNYPYLFDDSKFRTKSAERIADDWTAYAEAGVRRIKCLDSLFTMPRKRIERLCDLLVERDLGLEWICYARADDLVFRDTAARMREAGCIQVQIGIESGDQAMLDRMQKKCTVETNLAAMKRCAEVGLSSLVSVIVGYPGETVDTIEATFAHLAEGEPDFYYAAPFSVQLGDIPVMSAESRERFGLVANPEASSDRYWKHATMDCAEAVDHVVAFNERMMRGRHSLDASIVYPAISAYRRAEHREALLDWQYDAVCGGGWLRRPLRTAGRWAQGRLRRDLADFEGRTGA